MELKAAPFIGMVVTTPPPPHVPFDLYVDVQKDYQPKQDPAFCEWFKSLRENEITQPKEGDRAYRIVQISPLCRVEETLFQNGKWLSSKEAASQSETKGKTL